MRWTISWTGDALDDLDRLDRRTHARILRAVERFAETGHGDIKRLKDSDELRLRVGDWRVRFAPDPGKPRKWKRKGPKSTRAGCLLCKPHKRQGVHEPRVQERRIQDAERSQLVEG